MVFAHRVACVKPRFLKNIQKLTKKNEFYENSDFGNSEKHTKTQAKSRVFRGTINFRKPNLAKNTENNGHIFFAIQPKRRGTFCVTRPAAAPASQGGFGWGTAP